MKKHMMSSVLNIRVSSKTTDWTFSIKVTINVFPFLGGQVLSKSFGVKTWHLERASILPKIFRQVIFFKRNSNQVFLQPTC